jgi:hypothetical protein
VYILCVLYSFMVIVPNENIKQDLQKAWIRMERLHSAFKDSV